MIDWLIDTLVWTGALIALVLLIRRPVARHFGAQAAYMLWLLPFARLFVPAIELPAAFAPEPALAPMVAIDPVMLMAMQAQPAPEPDSGWLWFALAMGAWLTGAAVMLAWRYLAYFRMRGRLLEDGEEKLRVGGVRIVESGATESPLAFGILDKVIVVPAMFLETTDKRTRNLAIAHEMAHHERGDLIANFVAQPLFALHWFNPLGWLGWRALRRDQEAACDARVVSQSDDATRAAYAQTIARFSAGPDLALAAPMACPVLGEKSIIQRLRSLTMGEVSPRRRWAGRAALATGLLALPLTASFTYAAPSLAQVQPATRTAAPEPVIDAAPLIDSARDEFSDADAEALDEEIQERSEALEKEMERLADQVERDREFALSEQIRDATERKVEARLAKLGLGDAGVIDLSKLAELEKLGEEMSQIEMKVHQDYARQQRAEKIKIAAKVKSEVEMLERTIAKEKRTTIATCGKKTEQPAVCTSEYEREAYSEARRAIKRNTSLTDVQRRIALDALDQALPKS